MPINYGFRTNSSVTVDRSQWDALMKRFGVGDPQGSLAIMDSAVHRAAVSYRDKVREDTPVKTGNLQASIDDAPLGPSDHEVATYVWYAPIIEGRPPNGPKKGAMFAKNLAYGQQRLNEEVERQLEALSNG